MRCAPRTSCVQLAMAWSKPAENKKGGGVGAKAAKGGGKGGKGSKEAAGQGKGQGSTPAIDYSRLAAEMLKQKSVAKQEQGKEQGKHDKGKWCCPCGFADNFAKRDASNAAWRRGSRRRSRRLAWARRQRHRRATR